MRHRWISTIVVVVTAAATGTFASAGPAAADLVTSCTGEASNVTVPGDLFVPVGRSCDLTNVTVNGHTTVRAGANLVLHASTLNGNLVLQADAFVNAIGTTVTGVTRLNAAFGAFVEGGTLGGNTVVNGPGFFFSTGSSLHNVTSTNGETYLESVRLARNVTTTGDLFTDVYDSVVRGAVSVSGASLGSVLCMSEVDGNASVATSAAGTGGVIQIGAAEPLTGCAFNVFGANLSIVDNAGPSHVSDNVVRGTLACTGNTPAPVGSSARIRGGTAGQCAAGADGPGAGASEAAVEPGAVADRKADLIARIRSRTTEGTTEAAAAGRTRLVHGR
jgi:hypothetical protein